jgi:hypothetical protein
MDSKNSYIYPMQWNKQAFRIFLSLFLIETAIALWVRDAFVRPYLGDVLVILLIYYFVKSFVPLPTAVVATATLLFAFLIEYLQYLNCISLLGLEKNKIAHTVLGASFAWEDIGCYVVGFLLIFPIENYRNKKATP